MGYNGSNRKGYDVRYRGFPKSADRYADRLMFGRHGLVTTALKILLSSPRNTYSSSRNQTVSYSASTHKKTHTKRNVSVVSCSVPEEPAYKHIPIDFQILSNPYFDGIIADYQDRNEQFLKLQSESLALQRQKELKIRELNRYKVFSFFFKRKIGLLQKQIGHLSSRIASKDSIDLSIRVDSSNIGFNPLFDSAFLELFNDTKTTICVPANRSQKSKELPASSDYSDLIQEPIKAAEWKGPVLDSKCYNARFGDVSLLFYPTFLILFKSYKKIAIIKNKYLKVRRKSIAVSESPFFNTDGYCVEEYQSWKLLKDGTRFPLPSNQKKPVIRFFSLQVQLFDEVIFNILTDKPRYINDFYDAFGRQIELSIEKEGLVGDSFN